MQDYSHVGFDTGSKWTHSCYGSHSQGESSSRRSYDFDADRNIDVQFHEEIILHGIVARQDYEMDTTWPRRDIILLGNSTRLSMISKSRT